MAYQQGYRPPSSKQTISRQPSSQQRRGKPPARSNTRRRKGHPFRMFLLLVVFAFLATSGVMLYSMYNQVATVERAGTFYPGVYVNGIPLQGMTPNDAYATLLSNAQAELQGWALELRFGDLRWTIDANFLGLSDALDTTVREAVTTAFYVGRGNGSFIERYQTINALKSTPYLGYTSDVQKDTSRIDAVVSEIQNAVYVPAKDASWAFDPERKNNAIVITPEENGRDIDAAALKAQIITMVNEMTPGTIEVQPRTTAPNITAGLLEGQIVLIGNYESAISSRSTEERNKNIERGCQAFHGREVKPGEKVSFNRWVGERTEKNGFFPAEEIVSGSYEMGIGGGICQVSSALYNAVIQANLNVVSRTNHSIPVNYLEMGADATVSDGRIDFVFENNTDSSIYLIARLDYSKNACVFQIYGKPDPNQYTYELRHETIETIPIPEPTKVPDKKEQYAKYIGEEVQVTDGKEGYVVRTFLVTKAPNGNVVDDKELYVDTYRAQPPKIYVGLNRPE